MGNRKAAAGRGDMTKAELVARHRGALLKRVRQLIEKGILVELPDHSVKLTPQGERAMAHANPAALARILARGTNPVGKESGGRWESD